MTDLIPKVSVLMPTYNHEKYIEQAIRSIMMQQTDFHFELLIGEDCSTDMTRKIVAALADEFPKNIRLILQEKNIGGHANFRLLYQAVKSQYIAICEGDDYWIDPHKLQIQVDYMDSRSKCVLCFHSAQIQWETQPERKEEVKPPTWAVRRDNSIEILEWIRNPFIITATSLFRPLPLPDWFHNLKYSGDWPLFLWLILNGGQVHYIPTRLPMTIYRKHLNGASGAALGSDLKKREDLYLNTLQEAYWVRQQLDRYGSRLMNGRLYLHHRILAQHYLFAGELASARACLVVDEIHASKFPLSHKKTS